MKPYQQVPIQECLEPIVPIPLAEFAVEQPHPYVKVGAPYGDKSPYFLRAGVLQRLLQAQASLQQDYPGWRIQIFDAYRPIAVQQYMVDYSFAEAVRDRGLEILTLTAAQRQELLALVYQFWAAPSPDPATPPPHSTGAAVDVTLVDAAGEPISMGSPIDEMSPRSYPNHFAPDHFAGSASPDAIEPVDDRTRFHQNRQLLQRVMTAAGFRQHPREWWHFSHGDQHWAWLMQQDQPDRAFMARYGAI